MANIKRKFILGDEWIYFKVYAGPKILESLLINQVETIVNQLFFDKIIDKFFFIRYTDPHYHLRIRFQITKKSHIPIIIDKLNETLKYYVDNRMIWRICTDTYNRELERYGESIITDVETLFSIDSVAVIEYLKELELSDQEASRWLYGVKFLDMLLSTFMMTLNDKKEFCEINCNSYSKEFNVNKALRIQLDKKYRKEKNNMDQLFMNSANECNITKQTNCYYQRAKSTIESIRNNSQLGLTLSFNGIISSLIHMHFNRLFLTRQRLQEFIIYYFMNKFYQSQLIRGQSK